MRTIYKGTETVKLIRLLRKLIFCKFHLGAKGLVALLLLCLTFSNLSARDFIARNRQGAGAGYIRERNHHYYSRSAYPRYNYPLEPYYKNAYNPYVAYYYNEPYYDRSGNRVVIYTN